MLRSARVSSWCVMSLVLASASMACEGGPAPIGGAAAALTEGQVNALNNVGRNTGIFYALQDPPEPVLPELQMSFVPPGAPVVIRVVDAEGNLLGSFRDGSRGE